MERRAQGFGGIKWSLIANYINGESSESERRQVEEWLCVDPARRVCIDAFHKIRDEYIGEDLSSQTTAAWSKLIGRIKSLS